MQYVLVGHPCQDVTPDGFRWGGGVIYSGLMAAALGASVHVLTTCQSKLDLDQRLQWDVKPDEATTVFENRYDPHTGRRQQLLLAQAGTVELKRLADLNIRPDIVHLAPVANEVDCSSIPTLPQDTWLVASPQGWMRRTDEQKRVYHVGWEGAEALLPHLKALALSEEDIDGDLDLVRHYASIVPYVLYTVGYNGAILFQGEDHIHIDAERARVVDPTGAGDVIAAAFFVRLRETNDPIEAVRFGTIAAAMAIEAEGTRGIPNRERIIARRRPRNA